MSQKEIGLPGFWRFVWLFFMQPVTLHRLLRAFEIDPEQSGWRLFRKRRSPQENWWLVRSIQTMLLMPCVAFAIVGILHAFGRPIEWVGLLVGVAFGVVGGLTYFRIPIYLVELIFQAVARSFRLFTGRSYLHWSPVLYHDLSYFPHPFLRNEILAASSEPNLTRRVLDACAITPGQRSIGRKAESALRASEVTQLARAKNFQQMQELRGLWLPGLQGADGLLLGFSEAARYLTAAEAAFGAHHRLNHLKSFTQKISELENQLRSERNVFTQRFEEPLRVLREVGGQMHAAAEKEAEALILNPFRPGDPLTGESGPELFRGREAAVREIEDTLADASRAASLQLLAPRRSGKTSLLKMLPGMVPDAICVFFDLQAHPAASVSAFWNNLAQQTVIQGKIQRRIELPSLGQGPPMEAAAAWLAELDQLPNARRVLIAIDEFERLEDLFPGNRQEFLQLMGLLRATIQHRRYVRLLVSGAAPFTDLDRVWDDHFINARQIKLPFLDQPTAIGLLTQPSPDFPPEAIPESVAREVFHRTGGQPYLLQIFGSLLVTRLNEQRRNAATLADVEAVQTKAIEWAEPYFRDMHKKDATPETREALTRLAHGEVVDLVPRVKRWLTQRYLLDADNRLAIPLYGDWIEHYALV